MELKQSKPIIIEKDNTIISGLKFECPQEFAIIVKANGVKIQECDIKGAISIWGSVSDLTIQNNYIHDVNPAGDNQFNKNFAGITTTEGNIFPNGNFADNLLGAHHIQIIGNYLENCPSSTYLVGVLGSVRFSGNYSKNPTGPFPRGQMLQVVKSTVELGQIIVENNMSYVDSDDIMQKSHRTNGRFGVEDHINFYATSGTKEKPIIIRNNYIIGCSDSGSGSGIMLGDAGGSYYIVDGNCVIRTGNAGIGICGGKGWIVRNNVIFQSPAGPQRDGRGLQIERYGDPFERPILVENNRSFWCCGKRKNGDAALFCSIDIVEFKNNFFSRGDVFEGFLIEPAHEPSGASNRLYKPWSEK